MAQPGLAVANPASSRVLIVIRKRLSVLFGNVLFFDFQRRELTFPPAWLKPKTDSMVNDMHYPRFDDIKESVRHSIVLVEPQPNGDDISHFEVTQFPLARLRIYDLSIAAITINRREQDIEEDAVDDYFLSLLLDGEAILEQDDVCFVMKPGDLAVYANGHPYSVEYSKPSHRLLLQIPREIFYDRILGGREREIKALALGKSGLASIVINMFRALNTEAQMMPETDQHTLSEGFLELVGAVIRAAAFVDETLPSESQAALMRRILNYMDQNYADCKLSPEKVAEANGISMRYLHRIFRQSGTTVSRWIWERRLKSTREDLLDPAKAKMRISEIAFSRGFNDPAHFSRSFRNRFGTSPTQLRIKAAQEKAADV
jgi:AraC-like DNA-binding protein